MTKRRSLIWLSILIWTFIGIQSSASQESKKVPFDPAKKYTTEQLQEDFTLLRTALEEAHAGIYFYTPKEKMDSLFDHLIAGLDHPITELEYYGYLAPLIAEINDGHTGMMFSKDYEKYLQNQPILMPFKLLFIDGKTFLFRNYSEYGDVELGGEVVSINGHSMSEILEKMLAVQPSDGHNVTSKFRRLENTTTFGRGYTRFYGITTSFHIVYLSPTDGIKNPSQGLKTGRADADLFPTLPGSCPRSSSHRTGIQRRCGHLDNTNVFVRSLPDD